MNSPELYMNANREDEEMERDIREFMDMILNEEDEEEYTDYRKYFTYDMEITSCQGEEKITADLSKKQGSASNGEKQTPYFIILQQACCSVIRSEAAVRVWHLSTRRFPRCRESALSRW